MKKERLFILLLFASILGLLSSCSSTKPLTEGQYMLVRNNVEVVDEKDPDFDGLKSYVRPIPNKKFMDIFSLKTMCYSAGQPTFDKDGNLKDSKFRKMLRERLGEKPVLLDSTEIESSLEQLGTVMSQLGYFDADMSYEVKCRKTNPKKVKVDYFITAHEPYRISSIEYDIDIPEYRRIVVVHQGESLLEEGMQYNEEAINDEFTRIINLLRDEGYYYVEKSIIRGEVAYDMPADSTQEDPKTVSLTILMKLPTGENASRYLYKYYFNNVYVQTNFDPNAPSDQVYDTVYFKNAKNKRDLTRYAFVTPHYDDLDEPIKDFHYRTIANAIYTQTGESYSQVAKRRSSQAFNQLDNFSYFNIAYVENENMLDTVNKVGFLDAVYKLTRKKVHSVGGQIDLRNDKSSLSFTYTNRNIFKGAERLTINLSGGYFYYSLSNLFHNNKTFAYPEFGINASLDFPKLFLFNNHQKRDAVKYSTSLNFGVNYSGLYRRLMYNTNITYNWSPSYYMNHSLSPIDISTINNNDKRYTNILNYNDYPESYQNKFNKYFMLSLKYNFNYLVPFALEQRNHNMRLSVNFESSGLFLKGLNALFAPDHRWVLSRNSLDSTGYNYTTFEKLEFTWNYTYKINSNNSIAMHVNAGAIVPLDKESFVPYERGFYVGTSNSMRGWGYRGLGPGSYEHGRDSLFTGDVKFELNLEYRGTLYRTFKFGLFADIGNIWLSKKYDDMPGADFDFTRFYKEFALDVGFGLRLDFDFFVIRLDYAVPVYDPTRTSCGRWLNARWLDNPRSMRILDGLKVAIGYAF